MLDSSLDGRVLQPLALVEQSLFPACYCLSGKVLGIGGIRILKSLRPTEAIEWVKRESMNMVELTASFDPHEVGANTRILGFSMLLTLSPLNDLWSHTSEWKAGRDVGQMRANMAQMESSLKHRPVPGFPSIYEFVISFEGEQLVLLEAIGAALMRVLHRSDNCFYASGDLGGEEMFVGMNIYNPMIARLSLRQVVQRYPGAISALGDKLDSMHSLVIARSRTCKKILEKVSFAKGMHSKSPMKYGVLFFFGDKQAEITSDLSEFLIRKDRSTQW